MRRNGGGNGISINATGGAIAFAVVSGTTVAMHTSNGISVDADAASTATASFTGGHISGGFAGSSASGAGAVKLSVAGTPLVGLGFGLRQSGSAELASRGDNVLIDVITPSSGTITSLSQI